MIVWSLEKNQFKIYIKVKEAWVIITQHQLIYLPKINHESNQLRCWTLMPWVHDSLAQLLMLSIHLHVINVYILDLKVKSPKNVAQRSRVSHNREATRWLPRRTPSSPTPPPNTPRIAFFDLDFNPDRPSKQSSLVPPRVKD